MGMGAQHGLRSFAVSKPAQASVHETMNRLIDRIWDKYSQKDADGHLLPRTPETEARAFSQWADDEEAA